MSYFFMQVVLCCPFQLLFFIDNYSPVMSPRHKGLIVHVNKIFSPVLPPSPALKKGTNYSLLTLSFPLLKAQTDTW